MAGYSRSALTRFARAPSARVARSGPRFAVHLPLFLLPSLAFASPALKVVVYDAQGVPEVTAKRLLKLADTAAKEVSALEVGEGQLAKRDAPKKCADAAVCERDAAAKAGTPAALLLSARTSHKGLVVEASFFLDGEKLTGPELGETEIDGGPEALKALFETTLPRWARKGYGGVQVFAPAGAVVKVDGKVFESSRNEIIPVAVGTHQVDVVFATGEAELNQVDVAAGARVRLEPQPPAPSLTRAVAPSESLSALRLTSYGTFMGGALLTASGFVAGALSRSTASGSKPCTATTRDCISLTQAQERSRLAGSYAQTGNVLLGIGLALAVIGAALFVLDLSFFSSSN
jgi:hypothetical protein